jgi:Sulfate permease family
MKVGTNARVVSRSAILDPKLRAALADLVGGSAAGVLAITFGLSYSVLIFAGPLAPYLPYGVGITFISSAVIACVLALGGSLPFTIGGPEASTAAMTAILASSLVERMTTTNPTAPMLAPVLITLGLTSIATGVTLCGFGVTRMGRAIRYVPYPVVGGFLGATGCLVVLGAIRIVTGERLQFATLDRFANSDAVRIGGRLRRGADSVSDLAPLSHFVWSASRSDRRRACRTRYVLAFRNSSCGGAGLWLDLRRTSGHQLHVAMGPKCNRPLSLVRVT